MSLLFDLSPTAQWRNLLNAPRLIWVQYAAQAPQRALACIQQAGIAQLHAWDVTTGDLRPLTQFPRDTLQAAISADGEQVYYHYDAQGGQIGHIFRKRWDGEGTAEDLTPSLPAYISFYVNECYSGRLLGFMAVNQDGVQMFALDAQSGGTPHLRYESEAFALGPFLSYDGEISVIASTEGAPEDLYQYSLTSYNTLEGRKLHLLKDDSASILPLGFVPRPDDMRFLALHQGRPLWWNTRTGETRYLDTPLEGDLTPLDWSSDAQSLVLRQHAETPAERLYCVDWATGTAQALSQAPQGRYERASFISKQRLYAEYQSADTPPCVLELDLPTGAVQRRLLQVSTPPEALDLPAPRARLLWLSDSPSTHYQATDHALRAAGIEVQRWTLADWRQAPAISTDLPCFIIGIAWHASEALVALGRGMGLLGAIAVDGIADWHKFYASSESHTRARIEAHLGGTPSQAPERYRSASPVYALDAISAPPLLLFAQASVEDEAPMADDLADYWQALSAQGSAFIRASYDPQSPALLLQNEWLERILFYCSERLSAL
jgi:hypothetical protein